MALHLVGRAVKEAFNSRYVEGYQKGRDRKADFSTFQPIIDWFENGNTLEIDTDTSHEEYVKTLKQVGSLEKLVKEMAKPKDENEKVLLMELFIEGLHQNFLLTKRIMDARIRYTDAVSYMMNELSD